MKKWQANTRSQPRPLNQTIGLMTLNQVLHRRQLIDFVSFYFIELLFFILYYIYFYFFIIYVLFDYNADITLLKLGWMMHYHQILVLFISLFISNFSHFLFLFISFKTGNLEKPKIFVCTLWHKLSDHTLVIWNKVTP